MPRSHSKRLGEHSKPKSGRNSWPMHSRQRGRPGTGSRAKGGACRVGTQVPELTRSVGIKLNQRVSLRRCAVTISFADDSRPLESHLHGRLGCRGGSLALVPVRLCRTHFQALNERKPMQQQHMPTFWPSIMVFTCVAIVAFGALALIGWIALALLGY